MITIKRIHVIRHGRETHLNGMNDSPRSRPHEPEQLQKYTSI
jgi:hypothetical protein